LGHTACYAIPELGVILDAGTGMYRMVDYLQTEELDIYLSHNHPDHVTGLSNLEFIFWRKMKREAIARGSNERVLMARHNTPGEASRKVRVHLAPEHMPDVLYQIQKYADNNMIDYQPLQITEEIGPGIRLSSFPVEHRKEELCFGFRIDHPGGSLAYVTDTYGEPGAIYQEAIRGVDVLLHDCAMPDDDPEYARRLGHSHITPVARLAAEAQVGRLVLIHLHSARPEIGEPELELIQSIFPRTEVAFDKMEIDF
jgi:ribonuclease BN (tRNA processing enzyme)